MCKLSFINSYMDLAFDLFYILKIHVTLDYKFKKF